MWEKWISANNIVLSLVRSKLFSTLLLQAMMEETVVRWVPIQLGPSMTRGDNQFSIHVFHRWESGHSRQLSGLRSRCCTEIDFFAMICIRSYGPDWWYYTRSDCLTLWDEVLGASPSWEVYRKLFLQKVTKDRSIESKILRAKFNHEGCCFSANRYSFQKCFF